MNALWICISFLSDYNLVEICRPSPKQLWLLGLTMVYRVLLGEGPRSEHVWIEDR